ncbi:MAG: hypothetical protein U1E77_12945 [Inhella sp.]
MSALRCLLRAGARLDFLDQELLTAAFHGHWRLVQFLLEEGAPMDALQPRTRETALHMAVCGPTPAPPTAWCRCCWRPAPTRTPTAPSMCPPTA